MTENTYPHLFDTMGWVSPAPRPLPSYLSVVRPFHLEVWLGVVAAVPFMAGMLYLVARDGGLGQSFLDSYYIVGLWVVQDSPAYCPLQSYSIFCWQRFGMKN